MAAVGGKYHGFWIRINRPRGRFEFPVEEFIKALEAVWFIGKFTMIQAVLMDERENSPGAHGPAHAPSVPTRKKRSFGEAMERKFSENRPIGPAHEWFSVDLFGLNLAGVSVKKLDWLRLHSEKTQLNREW